MSGRDVRVSRLPSDEVYLTHVAHALGAPASLAELHDTAVDAHAATERRATLTAEGIAGCLVDRTGTPHGGQRGKVALARRAAGASAAAAGFDGEAVLMCSDTAPERTPSLDLWDLVSDLGASDVTAVTVGGHGCGNLGVATQLGLDLITGGRRSVLVVTADRVAEGAPRFLASGRTLLSDGAAACVLTTARPAAGYRVLAVASGASPAAPVGTGGLRGAAPLVSGLGRAVAAVHDVSGVAPADVTHVLPGNLGSSARAMLAMAVRVRPEKVYAPRAASEGHCYSADILVALREAPGRGDVVDGDVLLLVSTSVRSWFVAAVRYTAEPASAPVPLLEETA